MLASPLEQDTKVDITDLTHASVEGNGVFDVLMRAVNAHLQKEWSANRLKGTEYSTVYLGALESTMNASLQFLLARDKTNAEIDILKQQLVNLKVDETNAIKQGTLLDKQAASAEADIALKNQQRLNLIAQGLNIPKEGALVDAQKALTDQKLLTEKDALLTATAQRSVLTAQVTGFANDAKQKAAEIMIKGFSVVATNNDLTQIQSADYGISTTKVKAALDALVP